MKRHVSRRAKAVKAVCMFSGGLDSVIAAKIMAMQGIEVHALNFRTPFLSEKRNYAKKAADEMGLIYNEMRRETIP